MARIMSNTPGKVYEDVVILGSTPGEAYITPPGDIRAYNILTGKLAWQFHTVPQTASSGPIRIRKMPASFSGRGIRGAN